MRQIAAEVRGSFSDDANQVAGERAVRERFADYIGDRAFPTRVLRSLLECKVSPFICLFGRYELDFKLRVRC